MSDDGKAEGEVIIRGAANAFTQEITAGTHRLVSDEPAAAGGTGTGPTPYDLLLGALGACTSMTIAMYAKRKAWPVDGVTVRLRHSRSHAKDCETCDSSEARLTVIDRDIELQGPLDEAQRARLLDIANRCPVHLTLTSTIEIQTRLT